LEEQRCVSNGIFVRTLKEHDDAIDVITMLREDLLPFAGNAEAPSAEELAQVKSVTEKLAVYSHLFNE